MKNKHLTNRTVFDFADVVEHIYTDVARGKATKEQAHQRVRKIFIRTVNDVTPTHQTEQP